MLVYFRSNAIKYVSLVIIKAEMRSLVRSQILS
nr:MAG TPA: hypothetical protein [Caudoviricetes sp.]